MEAQKVSVTPTEKARYIRKGLLKFLSLKVLAISSLFIASLFTFGLIVHAAVFENEKAFDNRVFAFFGKRTTPQLIEIMKFFTFFGSSNFLLPAYVVLILYFIAQRKYRYALHIAIIGVSSTLLMLGLKEITHRQRPELPIIKGITNFSFPSGHALSIFIFCSIFVYIIWHGNMRLAFKWPLTVSLLAFAMTIGISRIVLKVHYPTDVIASFCLGNVWVISSLWLMRQISRKKAVTGGDNVQVTEVTS